VPNTAILVIAPEASFRRSLGFLLESEGWQVGLLELLPMSPDTVDGFNCLVVDDAAIPDRKTAQDRLVRLRQPVVLLVERQRWQEEVDWLNCVEKPLFGPSLIGAVRSVLFS